MSASLLGKTPGTPDNSYQWLLHAGAAGPLTGTARAFTLGDGSATPLSMTGTAIVVKGLTILGGSGGTIRAIITASELTATRTFSLPDQSGTLATLNDIGGGPHTHEYPDIADPGTVVYWDAGDLYGDNRWSVIGTTGTFAVPDVPPVLWNGKIYIGGAMVGKRYAIHNRSAQTASLIDDAQATVDTIAAGASALVIGGASTWTADTITDHPVLRSEMDAEFVTKGFDAPVVPENYSFTLTHAKHANKWTRLTATTGTTTITLTTDPPEGAFFPLYRAGAGLVAFSGGTVNGASRLPTIGVNMAFGLVHTSTAGTYDFV